MTVTIADAQQDRMRGTLLGLAWGDVLGCPVEFWSADLIARVFGRYEKLPTEYPFSLIPRDEFIWGHLRPLGLHSDDTQQALALIQTAMQPGGFGVERWVEYLLLGERAGAWRGTGRNFRGAIARLESGVDPLRSGSVSPGIGAAMKIGPLGALYHDDLSSLARVVFEASYTTHADVRAVSFAFATAAACALLVDGSRVAAVRADLPTLVKTFESEWFDRDDRGVDNVEQLHAVSSALSEALGRDWAGAGDLRDWLCVRARAYAADPHELAQAPNHPLVLIGGVHALCIGLCPDAASEELLADIVRQGGDADTVGAIAGSILGARHGTAWIPTGRLLDEAHILLYASALVTGELPESAASLIDRELRWTVAELAYREEIKAGSIPST